MIDMPQKERPACFGDMEKVFPRGAEGLREVPKDCWDCEERVDCLKEAVDSAQARRDIGEEMARREQEMTGGIAGFLRRWSRLKSQRRGEETE